MPQRSDTLIILPAYNEGNHIQDVIHDIRSNVSDVDILVVNDGSYDRTSRAARETGVFVVDLPVNLGIGGAVQTGLQFALRYNYKYAMQFDADGQHKGSEILKLLDQIAKGEADIIIGSRFLKGGASAFRSTFSRRIGIFFFSKLISIITRQRLTDPTSGFRAMNRKVIKRFARYYPEDYPEPEAIVLLNRWGFKITEVPTIMQERQGSSSSITIIRSIYYMVKVTLAILIDLLRKF